MSWRGLKKKPTIMPLWPEEWNTLIDSLDDIYSWLFAGTSDISANSVEANSGNFKESLYVQGKPVIKDGDPININDIFDPAKAKITEAVDAAKVTATSEDIKAITSSISETALQILDKAISILEEFKPVYTSKSLSDDENTGGLEITLEKGGRPNVNVYYRLGGPGELYIDVSVDGENWKTLYSLNFTEPTEDIIIVRGVAFPFVRARVPTPGIDVELIAVASR